MKNLDTMKFKELSKGELMEVQGGMSFWHALEGFLGGLGAYGLLCLLL